MSIQLTIDALEHYYEFEIFPLFCKNEHRIKDSFEYLSESIQLQQEIIKLKKQEGLDVQENERNLEKVKRYWVEPTSKPQDILDKYKEELKSEIEWYLKCIETAKENGWSEDVSFYQERLEIVECKMKIVETYTTDDVVKITGERPF